MALYNDAEKERSYFSHLVCEGRISLGTLLQKPAKLDNFMSVKEQDVKQLKLGLSANEKEHLLRQANQ